MPKATAIFDAEDKAMLAAMDRIDRKLRETEEKFAKFGEAASHIAELSGIVLAVKESIDGVKEALDLGSSLSNTSAATDIAVKDLVELRQEFMNAGKDANDIGPVMAKMMRNLETGDASQTIASLRLNLNEIYRMGTAQQFVAIGKAINGLESPMARVAAATAVFGKGAETLLPMFGAAGFGQGAAEIARQAAVLDESAGLFSQTSNELREAGETGTAFYVGFSSELAPMLNDILGLINSQDATGAGQEVGATIASFLQSFQNGNAAEIIGLSIVSAMAHAEEAIMGSFGMLTGYLAGGLTGAALKFGAVMLDQAANVLDKMSHIPWLHFLGAVAGAARAEGSLGRGVDVSAMANAMGNDMAKKNALLGSGLAALVDPKLAALNYQDADETENKRQAAIAASKGASAIGGTQPYQMIAPNVGELTRIGGGYGGGAGDPLMEEARKQTGYLASIDRKLTPPAASSVPRVKTEAKYE